MTCHYCREPIESNEPHTVCSNYPFPDCGPTEFCSRCVQVDASAAERSERIKMLFIALVTSNDLDGPRILPGSA